MTGPLRDRPPMSLRVCQRLRRAPWREESSAPTPDLCEPYFTKALASLVSGNPDYILCYDRGPEGPPEGLRNIKNTATSTGR